LDLEEPLDDKGERPLPLRPSSVEDEEDSLLRRLRLSFFDFFDFLGLDLDDRVDAARFALVGLPVLALADPFSSCV
jgi:hypothetical protein